MTNLMTLEQGQTLTADQRTGLLAEAGALMREARVRL